MVLYLPRDTATVPVSRQVLDGCLATLGVTPDTRADIALALTEACANVVLHAGPAEEYLVQVSARNGQCAIEVINADGGTGTPAPDGAVRSGAVRSGAMRSGAMQSGAMQSGQETGEERAGRMALADEPVPVTAEHGRGLKIIDAVVDNLQLTGDDRQGLTVHFEKALEWLPGAPGRHLFNPDGGS